MKTTSLQLSDIQINNISSKLLIIFAMYNSNPQAPTGYLYLNIKGVKKNQTVHSFLHNFFVFDSICMKIRQNMYE